MKISRLVSLLNKKVPFRLCEKWDNAGFTIGEASEEITGITAVLDVSEAAVDYAVKNGANLIIAHHPLIFSPVSNVRSDNLTGSLIIKLIRSGVNLAVLHTNFDKSIYNQSYGIAENLGLNDVRPLSITNSEFLYKLTVFVPPEKCAALKKALSEAGAGVLGNYSQCAYMTDGYGEFMGNESSAPAVGKPLKLERTRETRLEMVFNEHLLSDVTGALLKNHPYEEPAYDICQLKNTCKNYGYGVYGDLKEKMPAKKFAGTLKKIMSRGSKPCFAAIGKAPPSIKRVAIVNGSGFEFYKNAAEKKCDVFISGDITYHRALELSAAGLYTIDCSHFATESNFAERLARLVSEIEKDEKCSLNYKYSDTIQKNPMESI
jgi:dinuclear metal center YbgI/SA1388 family protein